MCPPPLNCLGMRKMLCCPLAVVNKCYFKTRNLANTGGCQKKEPLPTKTNVNQIYACNVVNFVKKRLQDNYRKSNS